MGTQPDSSPPLPWGAYRATGSLRTVIDLHTHSTVSDGSEPPERIPELAAAAGCSAVALTDHDSLAGLDVAAAAAARLGLTLVRGCEVSCRSGVAGGHSMHVLVYFVDGQEGPLHDELAALRGDRRARNEALVARLRDLGVPIGYDDLVAEAGGEEGIGRPHVATILVRLGVADDVTDAFDTWLGESGRAYVPKARIEPPEIADLARRSGAVAVLAHPLSLGLDPPALAATVRALAEVGFAGIEAVYGRYTPDQRRQLAGLARRLDLVATGGSDFHGSFKADLTVGRGLGDLQVPDDVLEQLAARRP